MAGDCINEWNNKKTHTLIYVKKYPNRSNPIEEKKIMFKFIVNCM
jgi:hypothetical protein